MHFCALEVSFQLSFPKTFVCSPIGKLRKKKLLNRAFAFDVCSPHTYVVVVVMVIKVWEKGKKEGGKLEREREREVESIGNPLCPDDLKSLWHSFPFDIL